MVPDRHVSERRRFVKLLGIGTGAGVGLPVAAAEDRDAGDTNHPAGANDGHGEHGGHDEHTEHEDGHKPTVADPGLVTVERNAAFSTVVSQIESAIDARDLTLLETIDHAANAEAVGLSLPPTTLFLFGTPAVGTPLMQASRSIAIDLPQKLLVWEDDGDVFVTYTDPQFLARRHGIDDETERLEGIAATLEAIATTTT